MKGWVYVISNPSMPGIVKVGFTMDAPEDRARELSSSSGVPRENELDYAILVDNPRDLEQSVHSCMRNIREGKEWFKCTVEHAVNVIKDNYSGTVHREKYEKIDRERTERERAQRQLQYENERRAVEAAEVQKRRDFEDAQIKREQYKTQAALIEKKHRSAIDTASKPKLLWGRIMICFCCFFIPFMFGGNILIAMAISTFLTLAFVYTSAISHWFKSHEDDGEFASAMKARNDEMQALQYSIFGREPSNIYYCWKCGEKMKRGEGIKCPQCKTIHIL